MNIGLRQLRAFLAVARYRHFRRAAESLHLTQPAVSRHISDLEAELGVRLFDRNTREVVPTEAGRYLESAMGRVLDELEGVLEHVHSEGERKHGKVRVASVPTLSAGLMPQCIAYCEQAWPELTILLRDQVQTLVLDSVRGGEVDFGVAIEPPAPEEFDTEVIMHDPFYLVCRSDHPLAARETVPWKALKGERLVLLDHSSGSRRLIDQVLSERKIAAPVAQEAGHAQTAFRMVQAGLGSSVSPGLSLALPMPEGLVVRELTPQVRRPVTLFRRHNRSLTPAAEAVWSAIRDAAAQLRDTRSVTES